MLNLGRRALASAIGVKAAHEVYSVGGNLRFGAPSPQFEGKPTSFIAGSLLLSKWCRFRKRDLPGAGQDVALRYSTIGGAQWRQRRVSAIGVPVPGYVEHRGR
jgi:hypothetical protein